jgi:K+/H+ antiporter YhaU regulatory subunit KhtT
VIGGLIEEISGASIVAIVRSRRFARELIAPTATTEFRAEDVLLVDLFRPDVPVETIRDRFALQVLPLAGEYFADRSQEIGMAEVMLTATSDPVGKTVVESQFRTRFGLTMIGLRHGATAQDRHLGDEKLKTGGTLLVIGLWKEIQRLRTGTANRIVLNLPAELDDVLPAPGKAPQAVFCLLLMVVLMITGAVPNVQPALIACLLRSSPLPPPSRS